MINTMLAIQLNIFMVILLSALVAYVRIKFDRKEQALRLFFALIALTIGVLVLEILSVVLNSGHYVNLIVVHKLVDIVGFVLAPLVPIVAALYVYKRANNL